MNKNQHGYTLLEILIGLIVLILIALLTMPLVYHFANKAAQKSKVGDSLSILKDASTTYYYRIKNQPLKTLSMANLYKDQVLDENALYNINSGKSYQLYKYQTAVDYNDHQLIDLNIQTESPVNLQALNPTLYEKFTRKDAKGKSHLIYSYTWQYRPTLDIYQNQQNARAVRFQKMVDGNHDTN